MMNIKLKISIIAIFLSIIFQFCHAQESIIQTRLHNIDLMRQTLKNGEYNGYDIIIISSTSIEEADYQQRMLERAFEDTYNKEGQKPIILSVVDITEGGQIIGSVYTWLRAEEMMLAKYPKLIHPYTNLMDYIKSNRLKVAAFHNGGKGERCSPLTQSLGNSRGAQKLVGTIENAKGETIDLDILLTVILQCSSFAETNQGTHFDTYWTSQIGFGSNPHNYLIRSNFGLDKFLVGFDKEDLVPQNIADCGTAALDEEGRMTAFYGNKRFATRIGSEYVINDKKIQEELLNKGSRVAYDFGSFAVSLDMWENLINFWNRKCNFEDNSTKSPIKRDIDPHFIQPCVRFLHALSDLTGSKEIERALSFVNDLNTEDELKLACQNFNEYLKTEMPLVYTYIWEDVLHETDSNKKVEATQCMQEVMEFYLLYHKTSPLLNLKRVFGYIDLGNETQWFRYRRPVDIMNEKFEMLTDLIGNKLEVLLDGTFLKTETKEKDFQRAREARLMRGITDDKIAKFTVEGKEVILCMSEVSEGKWIEGIYVKNSIIQNSDLSKGSVVINSVVSNVTGKILAKYSYLELSTAPMIDASISIVHQTIDTNAIQANKEVISDVYKTKLSPAYHGRMCAPIGYDPKGMSLDSISEFIKRIPYNLEGASIFSDKTARTEDGLYTFDEIREIEPLKASDHRFRESLHQLALESVRKARQEF
jgi:hypothetical protein